MSSSSSRKRGETSPPPAGYEVIRWQGRYFPVRLHLSDLAQPGASAFTGDDGSIISFSKRTAALLYLYQYAFAEKTETEQAISSSPLTAMGPARANPLHR